MSTAKSPICKLPCRQFLLQPIRISMMVQMMMVMTTMVMVMTVMVIMVIVMVMVNHHW